MTVIWLLVRLLVQAATEQKHPLQIWLKMALPQPCASLQRHWRCTARLFGVNVTDNRGHGARDGLLRREAAK